MKVMSRLQGKARRAGLAAIFLAAMAMGLSACGADNTSPAAPPTTQAAPAATVDLTAGGTIQEVDLTLKEYSIVPKDVSVKAGKVKFVVTNDGQYTHNLAIMDGAKQIATTPNFKKDAGPHMLKADLKPGTYKLVCTVPGHEAKGMEATLTVK